MKLTVLGSGSPEAYARRASSGYLLEIGATRILMDCGGGVVDRLVTAGYRPSDIDYLFFSHLHSDHMMDYARLVHEAWDEGGGPLKVFGPAPLRKITDRLFGPEGVFAFDLNARCELPGSKEVWQARGGTLPRPWPAPDVTEIAPGFAFDGDGWSLGSCTAPHAQPYLECLAFSVLAGGAKFAYSGDAGLTHELEAFYDNADVLLHWCYRLSDETDVSPFMKRTAPTPPDIAAMAARAGVKRLLLTHFRVHMDEDQKHNRALREMAEVFDNPSGIVEDLSVYEVGDGA